MCLHVNKNEKQCKALLILIRQRRAIYHRTLFYINVVSIYTCVLVARRSLICSGAAAHGTETLDLLISAIQNRGFSPQSHTLYRCLLSDEFIGKDMIALNAVNFCKCLGHNNVGIVEENKR